MQYSAYKRGDNLENNTIDNSLSSAHRGLVMDKTTDDSFL